MDRLLPQLDEIEQSDPDPDADAGALELMEQVASDENSFSLFATTSPHCQYTMTSR